MDRGKLNKKGLTEEITGRKNGCMLGKEGEHGEKEIAIESRRILGEKEETGLETGREV